MAMLWLTQPCHRFLHGRSTCDARVERPCPYFAWRKRFIHAAAPVLTEKRGAVHNRAFGHDQQSGDGTVPHASLGRNSHVWYGVCKDAFRESSATSIRRPGHGPTAVLGCARRTRERRT